VARSVKFKRGDIILTATPGDYGKPRPSLVIQSDLFAALPSVTFCMLTTTLRPDHPAVRITIDPSPSNGLRQRSQIAIDKITTLPVQRVAKVIGHASDTTMAHVTRALALFLGVG
jgi:mRNA interferase MazF